MRYQIIEKFYNRNLDLLSDTSKASFCNGETQFTGFRRASRIFCDNLVFWCPCNFKNVVKNRSPESGYYMTIIKGLLDEFGIHKYSAKAVSCGQSLDFDVIPKDSHALRKNELGTDIYENGYISFKVSLSMEYAHDLKEKLFQHENRLHENNIYLHDIDITVDCSSISDRPKISNYLTNVLMVKREDILDDVRKSGKNCISWYSDIDGLRVRIKLYNKFIQMLESSSNRLEIGSSVSDLLANGSDELTHTLLHARKHGIMRLEITVYYNKFLNYDKYKKMIKDALYSLRNCPSYHVSFDNQWKIFSSYFKDIMIVYARNKKVITCVQWYNSITGKKQGFMKQDFDESNVRNILCNYSFNKGILHYFVLDIYDGGYKVIEKLRFKRKPNSEAITLVPGAHQSLYPYYNVFTRNILRFEEIGIGENDGINIGWPKKQITKYSAPLASLVEIEGQTNKLQKIDISRVSYYSPGYSILEPGSIITIIKYGHGKFRGKDYIFVKTIDGMNIRCGKSLERIIDQYSPLSIPIQVKVGDRYKSNGIFDIYCKPIF
jgi:hypothetical protein